jgi:predicted alpha/beta superfamily hydrolase
MRHHDRTNKKRSTKRHVDLLITLLVSALCLCFYLNNDQPSQGCGIYLDFIHILKVLTSSLTIKLVSQMLNIIRLFIVSIPLFIGYAKAQSSSSQKDSIFSSSLHETRKIEVILPKNYDVKIKDSYDVLYVLDGEWYTELLPNAYNFAKSAGYVPSTIIVLIPNTYIKGIIQRNRDFEPFDKRNDIGYASFLSFIEKELFVFIDKKYPNNGKRSLLGSSLGGLFTVYTFLTNPDIFQAYLACDPNLDWNEEYLSKLAVKRLPEFKNKKRILFIATNDYSFKANGGYNFKKALAAKAPKSLQWQVNAYQNETHYSLQYKAFYDALRYNYSGFWPEKFDLIPQKALIEPNKPLRLYTSNKNPTVRFSMVGKEPTMKSPRLSPDKSIIITQQTIVKVKNLATREQYADSINLFFNLRDRNKEMKTEQIGDTSTIHFISQGTWVELPSLKNIESISSLRTDSINGKANHYTSKIYFTKKKLKVNQDGYYVFVLDAPDGSRLYLGDKVLINHSSKSKFEMQSFAVYLKEGYYTLKSQLFQMGDAKKPNLRLFKTTKLNDRWWENEIQL